ncbi:MAG: HAD family hydrolase [Firmicutes bacterium]|nr:HAD family hydrolase [Bacillota bacterium]
MIQAVLFDLGGTLHVSDSPQGRSVWFARRLIDRLADYGLSLEITPEALAPLLYHNSEVYKEYSERTLRELPPDIIWSQFFLRDFGFTAEQLAPMAEELSFLYDYERPRVMRRPHLRETMDALKAMGLRLGVISNIISTSVVPHFLQEYGLAQDMECVILSSTTGIRKPDAGIFRVAEETMHLPPEALAYVGDTLSRDVQGVRNAGWQCVIQIRNPGVAHRDRGLEGSDLAPDYRIDDLAEIPGILAGLNQKI